MTTLTQDDFLQWAAGKDLALDPQYPDSAVLDFRSGSDSRFWLVPPEPQRRPYFLALLLDLMGDWKTCFVWRHLGRWPDARQIKLCPGINDIVELRILRALGLPLGTDAVIEFARGEWDALITLLFTTTIFGWSVADDLYVVPDHARHILQTDHHDVVHVSFPPGGDLEHWVSRMSEEGFDLPHEPPDWTFKWPAWMDAGDR